LGTDIYDDDASHPIPEVNVIDSVVSLEGGGAYYGLVIAAPMQADTRSLQRLARKLRNYADDFYSPASDRAGTPTSGKMRIYVAVHPGSDPLIFDVLEAQREPLRQRLIDLVITTNADVLQLE